MIQTIKAWWRMMMPSLPKHNDDEKLIKELNQALTGELRANQFLQNEIQKLEDELDTANGHIKECYLFLEDMHSLPVEWTIEHSQRIHGLLGDYIQELVEKS